MVSTQKIIQQSNQLMDMAKKNELFAVASKILQKEGDTKQEAELRLQTFFQSLTLSQNFPEKYAFHEYEDKAFHACLLDNEAFQSVCKEVFGVIVNHMSWARLGNELSLHQNKADQMAIDYKKIFGDSKMLSEGTAVICWDSPAIAA